MTSCTAWSDKVLPRGAVVSGGRASRAEAFIKIYKILLMITVNKYHQKRNEVLRFFIFVYRWQLQKHYYFLLAENIVAYQTRQLEKPCLIY